jgi:hypothetical protein
LEGKISRSLPSRSDLRDILSFLECEIRLHVFKPNRGRYFSEDGSTTTKTIRYCAWGAAMKTISFVTAALFLLTSCSYNGTIYKSAGGGAALVASNLYRYDAVACIVEGQNDSEIVLDSGVGNTVIEFELSPYVQQRLKDMFSKTVVVKREEVNAGCNLFIYPKQDLACYEEELVYNFDVKMKNAGSNNLLYSFKTSETGSCAKSSPAFMFFSTLLFPPVIGGFLYGMNAYSKSKGNFDSAERIIRKAIDSNLTLLEKEKIAGLTGK